METTIIKDVDVSLVKTGAGITNKAVLSIRYNGDDGLTVMKIELSMEEVYSFLLGRNHYKDLTINKWEK